MVRRILIGIVFAACWLGSVAMARIELPQQSAPTGGERLYYVALDGSRALAYDSSWDVVAVPIDGSATGSQRELDKDAEAAAAFSQLDRQNRYSIIWRINAAKRPETRARRIATYLDMIRRGDRIN